MSENENVKKEKEEEKSSIGSLRSAHSLSVCSNTLDEEDLFRCAGISCGFAELIV